MKVLWLSFVLALATTGHGAPAARPGIPSELLPWIPWVLHGQEEKLCPTPFNQADQRHCFLPTRLDIKAFKDRGQFQQQWSLMTDAWVSLPGGEGQWPVDVKANGKASVVILKDGGPSVYLPAGAHTLSGSFAWHSLPDGIHVPPRTGLITLAVNGRGIAFPNLDPSGKLWFQKQAEESDTEDNHVEVKVNRLMVDEIPLQLQTRIELNVSGESRPLELGPVLPDDFTPMAIDGELPTTLQPNGLLKTQIRPGRWSITVTARHQGPVTEMKPKAPEGAWPAEEIWAFEAKNHLRMVAVEGVAAVDPAQTSLPEDWKKFPSFLVTAKDTVKLAEKRRGDSDPAADQLHLRRSLWLDFAGHGLSVSDRIQGSVKRAWRLEATPPLSLNRVAVGSVPQLITRRNETTPPGFEIREGALKVEAEGRIEDRGFFIPTTGWTQDFQSVSASLHLPPGWQAFAITGVDRSTGTWVSFWNLGNIFLVVLLLLAVARLKGPLWGAGTGLALMLAFPETGAPRLFWLAALIALVLYRVIPEGKLRRVVGWGKNGIFLVLIGMVFQFVIQQVRQAIYPVLEKANSSIAAYQAIENDFPDLARLTHQEEAPSGADEEFQEPLGGASAQGFALTPESDGAARNAQAPVAKGKSRGGYAMKKLVKEGSSVFSPLSNTDLGQKIAQYDPNAIVQVGPGLPRWTWSRSELTWSGPVSQSERIGLFLLPPWANALLALLRSAGVVGLIVLLLKESGGGWRLAWRGPVDRMVALFLVVAMTAVPMAAHADNLPSKEILSELKDRLLEAPKCFPQCAALNRMNLEFGADALLIRLEISAAIAATVPLPGNARHWLPETVVVDGKPAPGISRDDSGTLWLYLPAGSHQVSAKGSLPARDSVQIPLPMTAHNVVSKGNGWTVEGIHKDGQAESNLELRRIRKEKNGGAETWEASNLPPFVLIERELGLGLSWTTRTRIVRLTPVGSAVVLSVPLLAGESVTTSGVRVDKGKVLVNMDPRSTEFTWDSVLEQKSPLLLKAPETPSWTEIWRLDASPIWTVALEGIPVIFHHNDQGRKMPLWRPWPGEEVRVTVERPSAVSGQTLSIGQSRLTVEPGTRATDATLSFNLRSSRGGEHSLTLPEGAELQSITIQGKPQPLRPEGRKLTLPVTPGSQDVEAKIRLKGGLSPFFRNPAFDLGLPSVNASVRVTMPQSRWVLLAGGAGVGPAVLIWGEMIVILALAFLLAKLGLAPLKMWQWALLGIGLTQCQMRDQFLIVGLFLLLGWRRKSGADLPRRSFQLMQVGLVILTLAAATSLLMILERGFFGMPEMHVAGNGSYYRHLEWFSDRLTGPLPAPWVISLPLLAYRLCMLAWALWLAASLLKWAKWGWECFSAGGLWKRKTQLVESKP